MNIKNVGMIAESAASETIDGAIRLHITALDQFPLVEIYSPVDECGNFLWDDEQLNEIGKDLARIWNDEVQKVRI